MAGQPHKRSLTPGLSGADKKGLPLIGLTEGGQRQMREGRNIEESRIQSDTCRPPGHG
jgi:hypothetical protein